jgi:hypothetical protein
LRAIDPLVLVNGHPVPLSELDPASDLRKTSYLAGKQGQWGLRIENPFLTPYLAKD